MSQPPLFISPWLKVERAKRHIQEFHSVLNHFLQTDFYRAGVEHNPKSGNYFFKCSMVDQLPAELPLSMGDAVHNMRSALDHLAVAILERAKMRADDAYFPFDKTRQGLVARLDNGPIKKACPGIENVILDEVQPYRAGKTPLWEMNRLDNIDKHNLLIPALYVTQVMIERLQIQNGPLMQYCLVELGPGGVVNLFGSNHKFEVEGEVHPSFDVVFPETAPFEGQAVLPTLVQVAECVEEAIRIIEDFVRSSSPAADDPAGA